MTRAARSARPNVRRRHWHTCAKTGPARKPPPGFGISRSTIHANTRRGHPPAPPTRPGPQKTQKTPPEIDADFAPPDDTLTEYDRVCDGQPDRRHPTLPCQTEPITCPHRHRTIRERQADPVLADLTHHGDGSLEEHPRPENRRLTEPRAFMSALVHALIK
ncbi:hypothetical protein [Streptomyces mirabilis]